MDLAYQNSYSRKLLLEYVVAVEGVEDAAEAVVRRHHLEEAQARFGVPRPRAVDQHVLASVVQLIKLFC